MNVTKYIREQGTNDQLTKPKQEHGGREYNRKKKEDKYHTQTQDHDNDKSISGR